MGERDTHWCWVSGRTRVKRIGRADECPQCRRFANKHKCGMVRDSKQAWKPYPVTDCGSCMASGSVAEEPEMRLAPPKKPRPLAESKPTRKGTRMQRIQDKRKRKTLLVIASLMGVRLVKDYVKVLESFDAFLDRRLVASYLQELVAEKWLTVEYIERERTNKYQSVRTQRSFAPNEQVIQRIESLNL